MLGRFTKVNHHFFNFCIRTLSNGNSSQKLPPNSFQSIKQQMYFRNADHVKILRNEKQDKYPIGNIHSDIQLKISNSRNPQQIHSIIQQHHNEITHAAIYGKALLQCKRSIEGWKSAIKIMELFVSSPLKIQTNHMIFNNFFDCMVRGDKLELSFKYFNVMIEEYKIIPNHFTFSILIKGCRQQRNYKLASWYWELMIQYKLEPNKQLYTEIISVYSMAKQVELAQQKFDEYLSKINHTQLPVNLPTFSAYLNVFSRVGDTVGVENAIKIMENYGLQPNIICAADIMRVHIINRNETKCLEYFLSYTDNNKPNETLMYLKCAALALLMNQEAIQYDFEQKYSIYCELESTIHNQLAEYEIEITGYFVRQQLTGAIILYHNVDPMRAVTIFESMINAGHIGLKGKKGIEVDLHIYHILDAQFILRYVIGLKLEEWMKLNATLHLVVGSGKHGSGNMRKFVVDELLSYKPPIQCKTDRNDPAVLVIQKEDLNPYLQNKCNFAFQRLLYPNNDWLLINEL